MTEPNSTPLSHYGRGFEFRRNYYNGENLATCLDFWAGVQTDPDEARYDRMRAAKVRQEIVAELNDVIRHPAFVERSDRRWVYASLSNCSYALGRRDEGERYEVAFRRETPADWEVATYEAGKRHAPGALAAKG